MLNFLKFYQLKEGFDNVLDFLLNPEHRNKTFSELMKEFEASGGQFVGSGRYGQVYSHPNWNYVLKTFVSDSHYLKFVRFAYRNPHPSFPKFYGNAQRIIPFFRRTKYMSTMYVIRIEKLFPVNNKAMMTEMLDHEWQIPQYFKAVEEGIHEKEYEREQFSFVNGYSTIKYQVFKKILDMFKKYPQTKSLYEAIYLVSKNLKDSALDMHHQNIMQRGNGELVLTDPLWDGGNTYDDARNALNFEIGYEGEEDPENVIGGKLPKKPRIKKQKPYKPNNEIPF